MIPIQNIDIKINVQGIANKMQRLIGTSFQPMDLYDVYNTARDPDGQPYFWAVNNGTGVKRSRGGNKMHYWAAGRLISTKLAGPNRPIHMRERTLPLIRKYFSDRVKAAGTGNIPGRPKSLSVKSVAYGKRDVMLPGQTKPITQFFESKMQGAKDITRFNDNFWLQIMEDVMDYTIAMLAQYTPVLKDEYYSPGFTTEPGTLRESYEWVRRGGSLLPPSPGKRYFMKGTGKGSKGFKKSKKFGGSSYSRITIPSKAIANIITSHPHSRGLFTKLKRAHYDRFVNNKTGYHN